MAPQAEPAPATAPGLSACTPLTLPGMTGAARAACERRLAQSARALPALPLIGDKRKREEFQAWADYQDQLRAYKASPEINAHPCPPQKIPTHGSYLDQCALRNGALVIKIR